MQEVSEQRRPFSLHPTLPGVFARLMRDLRQITSQDAALSALMHDFEECVHAVLHRRPRRSTRLFRLMP